MRYLLPALVAAAMLLAGCATEPASAPPAGTTPDAGLALLRPAEPPLADPPPPSVKLVDLRRLRVGMTMEEVLAIFPGPEQTRISPRNTVVWRYEFAELYFRDGRLYNWFDLARDY